MEIEAQIQIDDILFDTKLNEREKLILVCLDKEIPEHDIYNKILNIPYQDYLRAIAYLKSLNFKYEKIKKIKIEEKTPVNDIVKELNIPEEYIALINEWLEYKEERNQRYKNFKSLKLFIKALYESSKSIVIARAMVNKSIANNWSGVFPLDDKDMKRIKNNIRNIDREICDEEYEYAKVYNAR